MIKEPGVFSQRYLMRKGKDGHLARESLPAHSNKENTNHLNAHHPLPHPPEHDFPLAYTSAKTHSRERTSVSANRRQEKRNLQELEERAEAVGKLQRELKESREQNRRLAREAHAKCSQYDTHIQELNEELREKQEMLARASESLKNEMKGEKGAAIRYRETIKGQIYWLLGLFKLLHEETCLQEVRKEVSNAFMGFKDYISEFAIEKELQALANATHPALSIASHPSPSPAVERRNAADSIFTEDLEEVNMIKIMQLQPLIETFNNQHYCAGQEEEEEAENKMERVTKRLFSESKFVGDSNNCSLLEDDKKTLLNSSQIDENEFLPIPPPPPKEVELPHEVTVVRNFDPDARHENYIKLRKGERLKLLRRIREQLWIGEVGEKIGLVSQDCFELVIE